MRIILKLYITNEIDPYFYLYVFKWIKWEKSRFSQGSLSGNLIGGWGSQLWEAKELTQGS